VFSTLT